MSAWKPRFCQWCGKAIKRPGGGKDAKKYCGKPCYFSAVRAGTQQFKGRFHDLSAAFADWAFEWDAQRPIPRKPRPIKLRPPCQTCGKEVNQGASRFCSDQCMSAWRGDRPCIVCAVTVSGCKSQGKVYCVKCKAEAKRKYRRHYKRELGSHRKKVRKGGGFWNLQVRRSVVLSQDRHRCYLCSIKCKKTFSYNDPESATVDMVVPASKGGDWDYHNLRCACRRCNSLKSDRLIGQLTLRLGT
jgi:5-methylcytosine-specific restriction endonuclease McrA